MTDAQKEEREEAMEGDQDLDDLHDEITEQIRRNIEGVSEAQAKAQEIAEELASDDVLSVVWEQSKPEYVTASFNTGRATNIIARHIEKLVAACDEYRKEVLDLELDNDGYREEIAHLCPDGVNRGHSEHETLINWRKAWDAIQAERDALQAENMCDVCCGTGKPTSELPCCCGGSGKASDQVQPLRDEMCKLMYERDALRARVEELERIAVAGRRDKRA